MKLKVDISVSRPRICGVPPCYIISSIEVKLSDVYKFIVFIQRPTSYQKFSRTSKRIIREINKNLKNIKFFTTSEDWMIWASHEYEEVHYVSFIESADLEGIRFSPEQKNLVRKVLEDRLKRDFCHKPSKPKSQMEYRKRNYYGKCNR